MRGERHLSYTARSVGVRACSACSARGRFCEVKAAIIQNNKDISAVRV